jgi:hypothetical protein
MFDLMLDGEYAVVGKTMAKSLGIVSEKMLGLFFRTIEGHESMGWSYICDGVWVEWSDQWDERNLPRSPTSFRVMPVSIVPPDILSERLARFETIPPQPHTRSKTGTTLFEQYTQRLKDEDDTAVEHRLIRIVAIIFQAVRNAQARQHAKSKEVSTVQKPVVHVA